MFFRRRVVFGLRSAQVCQKGGSNKLVVEEFRSVQSPRKEAPDQENALEHPVERYQSKDEIGKEFEDAHSSKHHPVGQPDGVVVLVPALDG